MAIKSVYMEKEKKAIKIDNIDKLNEPIDISL